VSLDKLVAVGCDGTNVNTGRLRGTVRLIEEEIQKPVQWFIFQLHGNELPFRHLLTHFDGSTSGPRAFSGLIGKELEEFEKFPIVSYSPIVGDLPDMTNLVSDLSTDQCYLYEMCDAVGKGFC